MYGLGRTSCSNLSNGEIQKSWMHASSVIPVEECRIYLVLAAASPETLCSGPPSRTDNVTDGNAACV
ncbi:hypothetical protein LY76DRAFT_597907 [Colletotrichum caudatum]|nr:hypothetical protein LY76DRAFT_597907 [Colletotrichum caudatum]